MAWDAGCGNGQAAHALARRFARVYATDASAQQIAKASGGEGLEFHREPVERCGLQDGVVDLVTAAQAAHWFDLPAFYQEVRRVLKPGGVLALFSYGANRVNGSIDPLAEHLRNEILGPYWPPERALVEAGYATLPFPFARLPAPAFDMRVSWTADQFLAYLRSWSSSRRYLSRHGSDPVGQIEPELRSAWGTGARDVTWPLALLAARVWAADA